MSTNTTKSDRQNRSELAAGKRPPGGKGGRKGRKPLAPVRVGKERNWGPIAMFAVVGLLAASIIGYAFWAQRDTQPLEWQERAAAVEGIVNYRETRPDMLEAPHVSGPVQYEVLPPVGGPHNDRWQNCQGDVYAAPIANEHAVHSLEHGAVWITYNPELTSEADVDTLAGLVSGTEKMFMSPFPGLDAPISLQAWGYQLKVDNASDSRVNEFVRALRVNASMEGPTAPCSGGVATTGTVPIG